MGSIPGSGRSPGEGNGNRLQYSCLENPMERGAWRAIIHRVAKSQTRLKRFCRQTPYSILFICESADPTKGHSKGYTLQLGSKFYRQHGERMVCGCVNVCSVAQLCATLCHPMHCNLPGSSVHEISQYWSGLPCPLQGIFPPTRSNSHFLHLLHWQMDSLLLSHSGDHRV